MGLGLINCICIGIGVVVLSYSVARATNERVYWRKKDDFRLHVTLDVVMYFLIGAFIVVYNVYYIICDCLDEENMYNRIIRKQKRQEGKSSSTLELKQTDAIPTTGKIESNRNTTKLESSC